MALSKIDAANFSTGTIPSGNVANASLNAVTALPGAIPTGEVLQVISTTKSDVTSSTSTSYADITGMAVSITPSSTSSKIYVMYSINVSNADTDRNDNVRLMRDSTALMDPAHYFRQQNNSVMPNLSNNFLDSPSSTSALSYHLEWKAESGTVYLNRRGGDSTVRGASTITVMEIGA